MIRFGLAVYFAVATLLSPWLCCCTVRAIAPAAEFASECCAATAEAPSCCCEPPKKQPSPKRDCPSCPCRMDARPKAMLAKSVDHDFDVSVLTDLSTTDAIAVVPQVDSRVVVRIADPFAENVRARLGLLCSLRC